MVIFHSYVSSPEGNLFLAIQLSNSVGFTMKYMDGYVIDPWKMMDLTFDLMVMESPMTKHLEILLIHIIYIYYVYI